MTPFLRLAALVMCMAGAVALWVTQSRRERLSVAEHRAASEAALTPQRAGHAWGHADPSPSPWEGVAEAQERWADEVKRHQPACDALGRFLATCEPLVGRVEARDGAVAVEVRSLEQFTPDPSVRAFFQGRSLLLAKRVDGRLRPCCDVCDPVCEAAHFAKQLPAGAVAAAPDAAAAGALLLIAPHDARDEGGHDVILIDVAGAREVARYRVFRGAAERRRAVGAAAAAAAADESDPAARRRAGDELTPFLARLLLECIG